MSKTFQSRNLKDLEPGARSRLIKRPSNRHVCKHHVEIRESKKIHLFCLVMSLFLNQGTSTKKILDRRSDLHEDVKYPSCY